MLVNDHYNLSAPLEGFDRSVCEVTTGFKCSLYDSEGVQWRPDRRPEYSEIDIGA